MEVMTTIQSVIETASDSRQILVNQRPRLVQTRTFVDQAVPAALDIAGVILQDHQLHNDPSLVRPFTESFLIGLPDTWTIRIPVKRWIAAWEEHQRGNNLDERLGECCSCTVQEAVHVLAMPHRAAIDGTGWGCDLCNLPRDGAVVVLCADCQKASVENKLTIPWMCHSFFPFQARILRAPWKNRFFTHDETFHEQFGDDIDAAINYWAAKSNGRNPKGGDVS